MEVAMMPGPPNSDGVLIGRPGEKLSDALYTSIRDEIVFGGDGGNDDLDERIYPKALSERFNVSPTPVREALMRLAVEGYIETIPRRGFRIKKPSPEQVTELWQVRLGLEVNAGELAIERLKTGQVAMTEIERLSELVERSVRDWHALSGREQIDLNARFHGGIVELSGNALLITVYRSIQLRYISNSVRRGVSSWRDRLEVEATEHRAIVRGLMARDADAYRIAAKDHVNRSLKDALTDIAAR
jgi:DNA-binding GntR family transcriptional regulator